MSMRTGFMLALMLVADLAVGATLTVRKDGLGDYATLQPALDAASEGDTVSIGPGEFTEWSMEDLSGTGGAVKTFGRIKSRDVTLIGAGQDVTIIGPAVYEGSPGTFSPGCLTYVLGDGDLYVQDLSLRNCYDGLHVEGTLHLKRCRISDCNIGVFWSHVGNGGSISNTSIEVIAPVLSPVAFDIGFGATGSNVLIEDSQWELGAVVRGVYNLVLQRCEMGGIELYSGAIAHVYDCRTVAANTGLRFALGSGGECEVRDSEIMGDYAALGIGGSASGARFSVANCRLIGGAHGVLYSGGSAGSCVIHGCDFVKGSGPMVECAPSAFQLAHDLRDNFWGITDEATIQNWIVDHNDSPDIGATVWYSPYAGQSVPTESATWGGLKALWR